MSQPDQNGHFSNGLLAAPEGASAPARGPLGRAPGIHLGRSAVSAPVVVAAMSGLCESMGSLCAVLKEWHVVGIYHLLQEWQTLIAGGMAFIAALLTVMAIKKQITQTRRSSDEQVAAIRDQIEDQKKARDETDRRRRSVVAWAVKAEGRRLETEAEARQDTMHHGDNRHASSLSPSQLVITPSGLLLGERQDIALLDDRTRARLTELADAVSEYNAHAKTRLGSDEMTDGARIDKDTLRLIDRVIELAKAIQTL